MNKTQIVKDFKERSIVVTREFDAPVDLVWRAFTESAILDQWWGPAPWRAETKFMDFSVGGYWLYAMVGPENEKHWARMNYLSIDPLKNFHLEDAFSDENGNINHELPVSKGSNVFTKTATGTRVEFKMAYSTEEQLKQIVEMGFEQGITACLEQLQQLISQGRI
jgi:uncharacterized protein YndB with AHSA1/START domain